MSVPHVHRGGADRWRCEACDWIGYRDQFLTAAHPFDPTGYVNGCPDCKAVDPFVDVCDEEGCKRDATCGTPTSDGYRRTCGNHMPKETK